MGIKLLKIALLLVFISLKNIFSQGQKFHVVEKGETLYSISKKYEVSIEKIKELTFKKYMDKATIIYKEDNNEEYFIICKKQTCSPKLKNLEEVKNYFNNL